ncbi:MAG: universal stress protein [Desulfobacterium sp.]
MNILVGYDPPHPNSKLIDRVIANARKQNAYVYLVTSLFDGRQVGRDDADKKTEELQKIKAVLDEKNISSEAHVLVGDRTPGEDITSFALEHGIDEIIIQIKKTSRVDKLLTGSNAQHIILNAPCAVVSVR